MLKRVLFFLLIFSFTYLFPNEKIEEKIQSIPLEDRCLLEAFFNVLLFKEAGAFVLFGDKPAAFAVYFDFEKETKKLAWEALSKHGNLLRRYRLENWQLRRGWETWKKYQHLFPSHKWVLAAKPLPDRQAVEVFLIHKESFKEKIAENLSDFKAILGKTFTSDQLFDKYTKENTALFDLLKRHHALLGLVLGFGRGNSWLFQKRDHALQMTTSLTPSFDQKPWKCFQLLYPPFFLVDSHSSETQQLQKKYLSQGRQIHKIYKDKSFLLATLEKFCEN
jgi:hypothetical protein